MPRVKSTTPLLIAALAMAAVSAGCLGTQRDEANNGCKARYVGRQKAACEMGVSGAYDVAKKQDGASHNAKYQAALDRCQKVEKPLMSACIDGVNRFKAEIAKMNKPKKDESRAIASTKAKKKGSRSIASEPKK